MNSGFDIRSTPKNPIRAEITYTHPIFSPKISHPIKTTRIGDIKISDIASPKGSRITPRY
jgi:hypothetical protein